MVKSTSLPSLDTSSSPNYTKLLEYDKSIPSGAAKITCTEHLGDTKTGGPQQSIHPPCKHHIILIGYNVTRVIFLRFFVFLPY